MKMARFLIETAAGAQEIAVEGEDLFAIGYAGRNMEKTLEHIRELEKTLGVCPPKRIPTIYQCGASLLTQEPAIQVVGGKTSGEVEYVLVLQDGTAYITVGSDHTDRSMENIDVHRSKQVCPKPIAATLWRYDEIKDHFDEIEIRSWQETDGQTVLYQEGTLGDILSVETICAELDARVGKLQNAVIFSGTVPLKQGFVYGEKFSCELYDSKLKRKIELTYAITAISDEER